MTLYIGDTYTIRANIVDIDAVKIEISYDNQLTWSTINEFVEIEHITSGDQEVYFPLEYEWLVSGTGEECFFKITGLGEYSDVEYITERFNIIEREILYIGDTYTIRANIVDIDAVKIEISRDNGLSWNTIENYIEIEHITSGDQEVYFPLNYDWTVTRPEAGKCFFKISGLGDHADIEHITYSFSIVERAIIGVFEILFLKSEINTTIKSISRV